MFPLHDNIPPRTKPIVTYALITACAAVFGLQLLAGPNVNRIVEQYGVVPARVIQASSVTVDNPPLSRRDVVVVQTQWGVQAQEVLRPLLPAAIHDYLTLISCIFLHGGWLHFLGNMWFLHIFGDNVEDRLGHFMFLLLYIAGGVVACLAQILVDPSSTVPTIGASGAIAAVMGAYVMLYPSAEVETLIPLPILFTTFPVPAPIFLGVWFFMQVYNGLNTQMAGATGVAWWAHIGGFVAGLVVAITMQAAHWASPPVPEEQRHRNGFLGL